LIIDKVESLPRIHKDKVNNNFCGTYSDYPELIEAICELSGIKAYGVTDDNGKLLNFTFEVVE
jgi:hypothetical protein